MGEKRVRPDSPPHIMHADTHSAYPTHTHGLEEIGLPEMFINASAFGARENGAVLNAVVLYLYDHEKQWDKVVAGEETHMDIWTTPEGGPKLITRKVNNDFAGVQMAYSETEIQNCKTGFIQLYVEGDEFVLTDVYFQNIKPLEEPNMPCEGCEGCGG